MPREYKTYTPYSVYEQYADSTHDAAKVFFRRPLIEFVQRYAWITDELQRGNFSFPLLEIGSGSSWGIHRIQQAFPDQLAIGTDLNCTALREGVHHDTHNLIQSDVTHNFSFPDGSFCTIICFLMLEQIEKHSIRNIFLDAHRVARPNAVFIISTFNRELFSPHGKKWFTPNKHEYTIPELSEVLLESGWLPERRYGQRFVNPHLFSHQSAVTQTIERGLKAIPCVRNLPQVQIFSPRMLNMFPSLSPHTSVTPVDQDGREPVIDILVGRKLN